MALFILITVLVVMAIGVATYAESKGFSFGWHLALSLVFSPILLLLIVAVRRPTKVKAEEMVLANGEMKKCSACAELIRAEANKCRYCGTDVAPPQMLPSTAE